MALFGFGSKRKPLLQRGGPQPAPAVDRRSAAGPTRAAVAAAGANTQVDVSELSLDDDDFSSMFGDAPSQFADTGFDRDADHADPWSSRLHLD
ncbi:MAG TPA: hypothetical protein VJ743_15060 [Albitalea sp.]|nr:hypothetical protein [Albitalea sp.]